MVLVSLSGCEWRMSPIIAVMLRPIRKRFLLVDEADAVPLSLDKGVVPKPGRLEKDPLRLQRITDIRLTRI